MFNFILDLLYPPRCIVCDAIFNFGCKKYLCDECENLFQVVSDKHCKKCGRPIQSGSFCNVCAMKNFAFDKNYSLFVYDDVMSELIHRFKFKNHPSIGRGLGKIMADKINFELPGDFDYIFPVPIHKIRRRDRGFNQAELLAKEVSKKLHVPVATDFLKRIKNTKPQWALNSRERENNLIGAFHCKNVSGKNIILLDDIFTTGSTINNCAKVLKAAGAKNIVSITLSITVRKDDV